MTLTCPQAQQWFLCAQGDSALRLLGTPRERKQQKFDAQEVSCLRILIMLCNTVQIEVLNN